MATHDYIISNASGAAVRADLNNALAAIATNNSSATAPTTTYAYQWWADTGSSPTVMKLRNAANSGWITLFQLDGEWTVVPFENGTAAAPSIYFKDSGTDTGIYSPGTDQVAITTGGTQRATVDSSGRLLVGTSSALTGTDTQYSRLVVAGNTSGASAGIMSISRPEAATSITTDEILGIISFADSGAGEYGRITCAADANAGTNDYPGRLVFSTTADGASSPTQRMRIDSAGRLLVGLTTTTAIAGVSVSHKIGHDASTTWAQVAENASATPYGLCINYSGAAPNGAGNQFLYCADSSLNVRAQIYSNGGLGNFQANNVNLSDRNTKKDISPAADTWDCIKEWEIVNYRYKDQPDNADLNLGVIAQQVAESCPEVITVFSEAKDAKPAVLDDEGNEVEPAQEAQPEKLGVKEQQMYWMAIKALQEAQVRIEALEAEVAALKAS